MVTGKRQHIVPQMMIRRFASGDGTLVELHKPTLQIGSRRRRPKGILFCEDFYRDRVSDFDAELLSKIEQKFGKYYSRIAEGPNDAIAGDGVAGAALLDWIASMLCRTSGFIRLIDSVISGTTPKGDVEQVCRLMFLGAPDLAYNLLRSHQFEEYQDWLSRPGWTWKMKEFTGDHYLVITDNPVCWSRVKTPGGLIVMVPITKHRILLGGHAGDVDTCRNWSIGLINAYLSAWAERSIFAADADTLEAVRLCLRGDGEIKDAAWCESARKPLLGMAERIADGSLPRSPHPGEFYKDLKARYGESILERQKVD
jgi:hypothetical protein